MGKYISIAILITIGSVGLLLLIASFIDDSTGALSISIVLFFLLSIIITQLIRLGEILKKNNL